ncbi:DUF3565 domain-containing protein [Aureliella helgolandensis]|uniref:DUF3565 domain-containing protein n=1 Tax=Aureliella helgolandensis TaxID=2527968 RepID=A0A518FZM9_9BACT|nr:DUF3565 domain-containing protein [Aureliella helgolandensis]QDV21791.1 hypothetical protein Q31a_00700 [Aureliella helgolandensis]
MMQPITGYHTDQAGDWVARLACGHVQHVRHDPPWTMRTWVTTALGRESMLGFPLNCKKCDEGAPRDDLDRV